MRQRALLLCSPRAARPQSSFNLDYYRRTERLIAGLTAGDAVCGSAAARNSPYTSWLSAAPAHMQELGSSFTGCWKLRCGVGTPGVALASAARADFRLNLGDAEKT